MKHLIRYFIPVSVKQIKERMKTVENNIEIYKAIINMPSQVKIKNNGKY